MIAPDIHQQPIPHRATAYGARDERTSGVNVKTGLEKSFQAALDKTNMTTDVQASNAVTQKPETEEMSFFEFIKGIIDIVNPLQHIPVISTIYRNITGDELSPMGRVAGGALYGGPIGAVMAIASAGSVAETGKDLSETVMAMFTDDDTSNAVEMAAMDVSPDVLNDMETSAGTRTDPNRIIWNDDVQNTNKNVTLASTDASTKINSNTDSNSPLASTPTSYHIEVRGKSQPAQNLPYTQQPVVQKESSPNAPVGLTATGKTSAEKEFSSDVTALSNPLDMQEAPAKETDRKSVPPELIAIQMMDGLDKYTAMKKQSMAPRQLQAMY